MAKNRYREKEISITEAAAEAPQEELFADLSKAEVTQHASVITMDDEALFTNDFWFIIKGFFVYSIMALMLTAVTIWLVDYRKDSAFSTLKGEVVKIETTAETKPATE